MRRKARLRWVRQMSRALGEVVEWGLSGSSLMSGHALRKRSAVMTGHGTAYGAVGVLCAWRTTIDNRQHGEERTERVYTKTAWQLASRILRREKHPGEPWVEIQRTFSLQLGSCNSRECDRVVKTYVSTGKTFTTAAAGCTGTTMGFRVTIATHESNCKMNWDVGQ